MVWEWSHSQEAYNNAYENLHDLSVNQLAEITAEWSHWDGNSFAPNLVRLKSYDRTKAQAAKETSESLANDIWDKANELASCDNGGFNAWVCPFGCHTVPFDRESN